MSLSEEQMAVERHPVDRHANVLAVPGSGKTHTMVERIGYLVEACRVDPNRIIAVMFNHSAAEELTFRLQRRLGKQNAPDSMTYHSLGTKTIKVLVAAKLAPAWKFDPNPNANRRFATEILREPCAKYGHRFPGMVADAFLSFVDRIKSDLLTPKEVWEAGSWSKSYCWFVEWFDRYEAARREAGLRFFSDLIYDPLMILVRSPEAQRAVAGRFDHIIVDEYQDICKSQHELIRFSADTTAKVMVVGDDDQTIYSWRGAKPSYILRDFDVDFPDAIHYRLTRTWRYGHALSCAASHVIVNNHNRADKLCISSDHAPNTKISYEPEGRDGNSVVNTVKKQIQKGRRLADMAILIRTYSQTGMTQLSLLNSSIPFRLEGGTKASVLDNPWVKSLIGWLGLAAGELARRPYVGEPDIASVYELRSILNIPPLGLSHEAIMKLCACVLQEPVNGDGFATFTRNGISKKDGQLAEGIHSRRTLWNAVRVLSERASTTDPHKLLSQLYDRLDIERAITKFTAEGDDPNDQIALVKAFISYAGIHGSGSVTEFLRHLRDLQSFSDKAKESTEALHITSLHRAKGLEWPCVIMIGLTQGRLPLSNRLMKHDDPGWPEHLEDERRLFYVGITRAKEQLCLIGPVDIELQKSWTGGRSTPPRVLAYDGTQASQFLYEMNLYLSSMMPLILFKDRAASAKHPGIANEYLTQLGHHNRVTPLSDT